MRKFDVQMALEGVAEADLKWREARRGYLANRNKVLARLLHEAAANFMSAREFAKFSGLPISRVRAMMREVGLNPKSGKRLLAETAADALATNSALLGMAPHEMDLMSPLAYLPMGSEMRQRLADAGASKVTELDDPSSDVERFQKLSSREKWLIDVIEKAIFDSETGLEAAFVATEQITTEDVHGVNYVDDEIGCGHLAYNDPVLVTSDLDKITCEGCRATLVRA
jgi:hypothetical protein